MEFKEMPETDQEWLNPFNVYQDEDPATVNYIARNYPLTCAFMGQGYFECEEIDLIRQADLMRMEKALSKAHSLESPAMHMGDVVSGSYYYSELQKFLVNENQSINSNELEWLIYSSEFELSIIRFNRNFKKQYKRLTPKAKDKFADNLRIFIVDPSYAALRLHALRKKFEGYYSINVSGDLRALFTKDEELVTFAAIGTHTQIYRSRS